MFTKGEGTKEVRSKIRVYLGFLWCVRPMVCVSFDTKKYARKVYSLSLTQRKEGKKGATTQSPPFLLSRSLAFRGVVFAVVMGVTDVKVHTF